MITINTEIHSLADDESLIVATKSTDDRITLRFYTCLEDYKGNYSETDLHLTTDFIKEITRVFIAK